MSQENVELVQSWFSRCRVQDAEGLRRGRGDVPADPWDRADWRGGGGARGRPRRAARGDVAALMGDMGRAFDGGYAEYAHRPRAPADRARHHAAMGRARRAARDVRDRRRLARAPRHGGGRDAAAARRNVLGRPRLPPARPRRRPTGDRDDAQRGEAPAADRARRRGHRARGRPVRRARPGHGSGSSAAR